MPNVTPDRGSKPTAAKSYAQHRPAAAGRTPEQGAAPTGAADSLPPAGAGVGEEDSPNCVKVVFCAPLRGLQLALFGGGDTIRPRPAAARCLPAETGELRQIPTFAPPLWGLQFGRSFAAASLCGARQPALRGAHAATLLSLYWAKNEQAHTLKTKRARRRGNAPAHAGCNGGAMANGAVQRSCSRTQHGSTAAPTSAPVCAAAWRHAARGSLSFFSWRGAPSPRARARALVETLVSIYILD